MASGTKSIKIRRFETQRFQEISDEVSVEEPLEIRLLQGSQVYPLSVTMRTPGNDDELSIGFLVTEGIIRQPGDVIQISQVEANIVTVEVTPTVSLNPRTLSRNFYTTSSCGVCGKSSIDAIRVQHQPIAVEQEILLPTFSNLLTTARLSQSGFEQTGGSHASSLFNIQGKLMLTREDVGRHNALDKLIGHFFTKATPLRDTILLVSGRASFELVQKAAVAGIPLMAAIGAPSSLAIELANEAGITLIGFLKSDRFNVYSHAQRIKL